MMKRTVATCSIVRYCKALLLATSHWFIPHVTCVDWFCACYWWCALPRPYCSFG